MVAPSTALNPESISAPSTPTRSVAPKEEKAAAMTSSEAPEVADVAKETTSAEPEEAEKVAPAEAAKVAEHATSTEDVVEAIVEADWDTKSDAKDKSAYTTIIDLINVIEAEQKKHTGNLSWVVPACFDPCTSTAQEAANDELMTDAENLMKEKNTVVDVDTQAQVIPDSKPKEASADAPETKPERPKAPVAPIPEVTVETIGSLIQDLFDFDNSKVNAALDAFDANLYEDKKKCDKMVTVGGCHALVQLVKNCVAKAIEDMPDHDHVTDLSQPEVKTLFKSLAVITNLTYHHDESQVGISVIGGVEAVVKVMKTFPLCRELQRSVCASLCNLTCCPVGKKKALEAGGITALIAAVTNHTSSALICQHACDTLDNVIDGSMEQTKVFMDIGGVAALSKVRDTWPDNKRIQGSVLGLSKLIRKEMKSWTIEE